jgi:trehalose 6-phosphate phosphatase
MTPASAKSGPAPMGLDLERSALFFDFDGTLVDIAPTPDSVAVPQSLGSDLVALARRAGGALALLSGRRIADLDVMLRPHRLDAAGVHGSEMRIGSQYLVGAAPTPEIGEAARQIRHRFAQHAGLVIEDKAYSVAVHWRLRPDLQFEVLAFVTGLWRALGSRYRLQPGKCVVEIVGSGASKGTAMLAILDHQQYRLRKPVVFGDDLTDEDAFRSANERGGISVRIGEGPTVARYQLPSARLLRTELAAWAAGDPMRADWEIVA